MLPSLITLLFKMDMPLQLTLRVLGETGSRFQRWMLSLEDPVHLCDRAGVFFPLFLHLYLFNQEEAACALEFIQRRFVGINPEKGTKAAKKKKEELSIHPSPASWTWTRTQWFT